MKVFEPGRMGQLLVRNRLVRSATYEALATENGRVTDKLVDLHKTLAKGGVGLIITGYTYVQEIGKGAPHMTGIDRDDLIPGLRRITEAVHTCGEGCKVAVQLTHCGRQTVLVENPPAPSAVFEPVVNRMPKEMSVGDIQEAVEAFAEAARRAKEAGFDAVQLHGAHGYLLSGFLSPYTNRRTDEYGGNTKNRTRILKEIYFRIAEKTGNDFPVLIKLNVSDFIEGGVDLNESKKIAERLSRIGIAAIETSGGMFETRIHNRNLTASRTKITSKDKEAYFLPYAREIKKVVDVPLILVGGIRSLDVIEQILKEGSADFVALSRPLIREPDLPNRWLRRIGGLTAQCISCNACYKSLTNGGVRCVQKEEAEKKVWKES
ncbi:NADH:flavin oxidoreductase [Candidatus Bathyarchaeota archaeon]|nr:NADH:flavin oxidoreductase [Candidatus Bathyarchaeota archaeon]